jgi:ribosomal protein S18 acetylase RimI-like enzyme
VREDMRNQGVATHMVNYVIDKLNKLNINKVRLVAFKENKIGNKFWKDIGFAQNKKMNIYEKVLNASNLVKVV